MKYSVVTILTLLICFHPAQAQLNFPDGSTFDSGQLTNVVVVQAEGTSSANGTALISAMADISGSNTVPTVVQLAGGTYDLGASTLTMKPFVSLRGVGVNETLVQGDGSTVIQSDANTSTRNFKVTGSASGVTLLNVDSGDEHESFRMAFLLETSSGGTSTCLSVSGGAEVDATLCEFGGDADNSTGTRRGVYATGAGSQAFLEYSIFDFIEESQNGGLLGVVTASSGEVELISCDMIVERDTSLASGGSVTGLVVGAGCRAIAKNSTIETYLNTSGGAAFSTAATNSGGFIAFSTLFQGSIPAGEFYNSDIDQLTYSQCSQNYTDL